MLTNPFLQKSEKVIFKSPPAFLKNGHFKMSSFQNFKLLFTRIFMDSRNYMNKNLKIHIFM